MNYVDINEMFCLLCLSDCCLCRLQETTAEKREAIIQANSFRQALEDVEKANQVKPDLHYIIEA